VGALRRHGHSASCMGIQISFSNGRTVARLITRGIAVNHGFTSPLCPE
jgi:hypothetical protein